MRSVVEDGRGLFYMKLANRRDGREVKVANWGLGFSKVEDNAACACTPVCATMPSQPSIYSALRSHLGNQS